MSALTITTVHIVMLMSFFINMSVTDLSLFFMQKPFKNSLLSAGIKIKFNKIWERERFCLA